ncbi:hypothetical protein [Streptomyces sp. NPDC050263]|uniref:DUF6924 domain-containing protein n=1 Tax=Streptomyces sp. NPDC050263 TaxID=3155037 RepID=UPI00341EA9F2
MALPRPDDLTSLVLRTGFGDDAAWSALREAVEALDGGPHATWVHDPRFDGVSVQDLIPALMHEDNLADEADQLTHLFLADERGLLALDLSSEPGRTFRIPRASFPEISANLCRGEVDFEDYADCVDASGTFRGPGPGLGLGPGPGLGGGRGPAVSPARRRPWRSGDGGRTGRGGCGRPVRR